MRWYARSARGPHSLGTTATATPATAPSTAATSRRTEVEGLPPPVEHVVVAADAHSSRVTPGGGARGRPCGRRRGRDRGCRAGRADARARARRRGGRPRARPAAPPPAPREGPKSRTPSAWTRSAGGVVVVRRAGPDAGPRGAQRAAAGRTTRCRGTEADPAREDAEEAGAVVGHFERVLAAEVHRHRRGRVHEEAAGRRPDARVEAGRGQRSSRCRSRARVDERADASGDRSPPGRSASTFTRAREPASVSSHSPTRSRSTRDTASPAGVDASLVTSHDPPCPPVDSQVPVIASASEAAACQRREGAPEWPPRGLSSRSGRAAACVAGRAGARAARPRDRALRSRPRDSRRSRPCLLPSLSRSISIPRWRFTRTEPAVSPVRSAISGPVIPSTSRRIRGSR